MSQLEGDLSVEIKNKRNTLVHLASQMQVIIDYPDEDLEDVTTDDIEEVCAKCLLDTKKLLQTADSGKIIRDGIRTAIVGKPNVGKSSILNRLLGQKIAIVSDKPQTTRTRIMGVLTEGETQLEFTDTPGYHRPHNKLGEKMI